MRKKYSLSLDEDLIEPLKREADSKNLSLSRLIENKLKGINKEMKA